MGFSTLFFKISLYLSQTSVSISDHSKGIFRFGLAAPLLTDSSSAYIEIPEFSRSAGKNSQHSSESLSFAPLNGKTTK